MKSIFKRVTSLLICTFMFMGLSLQSVFAYSNNSTNSKTIRIIKDDCNECMVLGEYKGDLLYATLNKITCEITMKSVEKPKIKLLNLSIGSEKHNNFKVDLKDTSENTLSANIININTKHVSKINIDKTKVKAQLPAAIPLVEILGPSVLSGLLAAAKALTVGGVTYIGANALINTLKNSSRADYYEAITKPGDNVYIGKAISKASAQVRAVTGKDVFCTTKWRASSLARFAGNRRTPVGPELGKGKGKQYWHYHPYKRKPHVHIFYME